ncbi:glycosyltransferase family 4 protein [Qipengyuania sp. SS22]|nr:glycosyltransferase family 4 protein [Qipengyuania sp. SS22]
MVGNAAFTMQKFRGHMITFLIEHGFRVHCFAPDYDAQSRKAIEDLGATPVDFEHERSGTNPLGALVSIRDLVRQFKRLNIDVVFCYFLKPIVVSNIAAKIAKVPTVYSMIEGRGMLFGENAPFSFKRQAVKRAVTTTLRAVLPFSDRVFVLNKEDRAFAGGLMGSKAGRVTQLNGIGLDIDYYAPHDYDEQPLRFIFCGRLLKSKGVVEFVRASEKVRAKYPEVECTVIGDVDENVDSATREEIESWDREGHVDWLGFQPDTRPFFHRHAVLVLPTFYPEGLPRSIQESLSMACPVITTEAPGCGEQIDDGVTGFVVKSRDSQALADKMIYFAENTDRIAEMGEVGRRYAEKAFESDAINRIIFRDLLPSVRLK